MNGAALRRWLKSVERRAEREAEALRESDPKLAAALDNLAGQASGLALAVELREKRV